MENVKRKILFGASNVALVVTALTFATRGGFIAPWMEEFGLTASQVGWIVGTAFWGFTLAMVVLGPLVDIMGINKVLAIAFAAATVFAIGVAYFWPNMLGVVAEKVPTSGALGLALTGGFGFFGGSIAQPAVGRIYDLQLLKLGNELDAGAMTLKYVIIFTVILTIAFLYLFLKYRKGKKIT